MFNDELEIALHAVALSIDEADVSDDPDLMDIEGLCVSPVEVYDYDTVPHSLSFD